MHSVRAEAKLPRLSNGPGPRGRSRTLSLHIAALGFLVSSALAGCAVGPDYHKPDLKMPAKFAAVPVAPGASNDVPMAQSKWWKTLGDDELSLLIERAIKANPQLEIALAHVQEWRLLHQSELLKAWALAQAQQSLPKIDPLE